MQPPTVKDGLLEGLDGDEPHLLGGRCGACDRCHFPAAEICPYCAAADCVVVPLSRHGRLDLYTTVTNRPPGYDGPLPYGFGVVELPEGIRLITRLRLDDQLQRGSSVALVVDNVAAADSGTMKTTYAFAPDSSASPPISRVEHAVPATGPARPLGARAVYIAGVGLHPFGRFEGKTSTDLGVAAVRAALADAGVGREIEAAYCGTVYGGVAAGHKVLTALGCTGMPIINVEAGCASGAAALRLAAMSVASGAHDTVLVLGLEKMPKGIIRSTFFEPWREQAGLAATPAYFALRARRLMHDAGVTDRHLALVAVKNHRHGVHNPDAMYRKEISVDDVLSSPMVCDPLRLFMLCSPNEGAAAVVVSAKPSVVRLRAVALRSHLPGSVLGEHTPLSGLVCDDIPSPTELAAADAYELAGVAPADLDVVELQDTDSARELLSYAELGLCSLAELGRWMDAGRTTLTGALPVNPSGGLLSKGEPLGASALAQVVEITRQLRGAVGARQVDKARLALAHTVGRGANAAVAILSR